MTSPENTPAFGGHMLYDKHLEVVDGNRFFVKAFDPTLLTDQSKAAHMYNDLRFEGYVYDFLRQNGFEQIPEIATFANDQLRLSAYMPDEGWHWDVPTDARTAKWYSEEILDAIDIIASVPELKVPHESVIDLFLEKGWLALTDPEYKARVFKRIENFLPQLHAQSLKGAELLIDLLQSGDESLAVSALAAHDLPRTHLGHFDARPSNIGWHELEGVKFVDWSWAANTADNTDSTMFLIDLHKADFETRNLDSFDKHFNPEFAALVIGYWLARTIAPGPDPIVRFHQFASAATAATLIK